MAPVFCFQPRSLRPIGAQVDRATASTRPTVSLRARQLSAYATPSTGGPASSQAADVRQDQMDQQCDRCGHLNSAGHVSRAPAATRRQVLVGSSAVAAAGALAAVTLGVAAPAHANMLGDSIKGVLLRARRQNGGAKLLAPFESAKMRLQQAMETMTSIGSEGQAGAAMVAVSTAGSEASVLSALQDVRASSLNCYIFEALPGDSTETRASLFTQQLALADPCTFRLVVKNVVDFSPPEVQDHGDQLLTSVIRSYTLLDDSLLNAMQSGSSVQDMTEVRQHLQATYEAVAALESFVQETLMV